MLTEEVKQRIQSDYRSILAQRNLSPRVGQRQMIAIVARTLSLAATENSDSAPICVVEAGTGTGKTLAYMLPSIAIAQELDKCLVISTATVALQQQVVQKDLPDLIAHTSLNPTVVLAKGRSRYLCPLRLEQILDSQAMGNNTQALYDDEKPKSFSQEQYSELQDMLDAWQQSDWDGDRDQWPLNVEPELWGQVTTNHRQCVGRKCRHIKQCPFFVAREQMSSAAVIVANHDLVLSDLSLGGGVILPPLEDTFFVFDEAHHLPKTTLDHFAFHDRLIGSITWLNRSEKSLSVISKALKELSDVVQIVPQVGELMTKCKGLLQQIYDWISHTLNFPNGEPSRIRFERGEVPRELQYLAASLAGELALLSNKLQKINQVLSAELEGEFNVVPRVDLEHWHPLIGEWLGRVDNQYSLWSSYGEPGNENREPDARWITFVSQPSIDFEVCTSPILASFLLKEKLWDRCAGAVLTSATLSSMGNFSELNRSAGIPESAAYEIIASPFDYAERGCLRIPQGAEEGGNPDRHTLAILNLLPNELDLAEASLVLFSSRRQMREIVEGMPEAIKEKLLIQDDIPKKVLLETHKQRVDNGEGSIIFGLASFAEGIDLPGHYCRHVIIAKLPFSVPDDPIKAALAEWIELQGGNPFMELAVPEAAMKLVQACGRLLRNEQDFGKITLLDRRLISKAYGKQILEHLPPFRRDFSK